MKWFVAEVVIGRKRERKFELKVFSVTSRNLLLPLVRLMGETQGYTSPLLLHLLDVLQLTNLNSSTLQYILSPWAVSNEQRKLETKNSRWEDSPPLASETTELRKSQPLAPPKCSPAPRGRIPSALALCNIFRQLSQSCWKTNISWGGKKRKSGVIWTSIYNKSTKQNENPEAWWWLTHNS